MASSSGRGAGDAAAWLDLAGWAGEEAVAWVWAGEETVAWLHTAAGRG